MIIYSYNSITVLTNNNENTRKSVDKLSPKVFLSKIINYLALIPFLVVTQKVRYLGKMEKEEKSERKIRKREGEREWVLFHDLSQTCLEVFLLVLAM